MSRKIQFRLVLGLLVSFLAFTARASDETDRELCESTLAGRCAATSSLGCECQGSEFVSLAYNCMKSGAQFYCQSEQDQCECRYSDGRIQAHFLTSIPPQMRGKNLSYAPATGPGLPVSTNPTNTGDKGTGNGTNPPTGITNANDPTKPQDANAAATQQQQQAQQPKQEQPKQPPQMPSPPGGGGDQKPQDGGSPQFGQCQANPAMNDDSGLKSDGFCSSGKGQVEGAIQKFKQAKKKCGQDNQQGNMKCYESCNQNTKNAISNARSNALGTIGGAGNTTKTSNVASGQNSSDLAGALEKHKAECSAAKGQCDSSCAEANKAKDELKQKAQQAAQQCQQMEGQQTKDQKEGKQSMQAASQISQALGKEDQKSGEFGPSLADKTSQCGNDMSRENNGAAKNIGELMKALADALKNANDSKGDGGQATTADATGGAANPCDASARLEGCSLASSGTPDATKLAAATADPRKPASTAPGTTSSTAGGLPDMGAISGGSDSGAAAGAAGSSGGAGGAGGFSKTADKETVKTIPNGNILGGIDSGGGGGGGWSSSAKKAVEALRSYLPGHSKAPVHVAGQGITGPGGWTNWDKVRRRYEDKRATFLNEE